MSLTGELNYFLGLQIKKLKEEIFVCKAKYSHELLKCFRMADSKSNVTLMPTNGKLDRDEHGKDVNIKMYRGMIKSLIYLTA